METFHITHSAVFVNDIRLHAFHGVLPQERATGNDYLVSVSARCPVERAARTDEVRHTLNYAEVYEVVKTEMGIPSRLVEHVAGRIARRLLERFALITSVRVSVTKCNPPMGAQCAGAGVVIEMERP